MGASPAPHVFLWQGLAGDWGSFAWAWVAPCRSSASLLAELLHGRPCLVPPSTGMTHEDIVQESKKYWQQMEAHAGKASSGLVRPSIGVGGGMGSPRPIPHPFNGI